MLLQRQMQPWYCNGYINIQSNNYLFIYSNEELVQRIAGGVGDGDYQEDARTTLTGVGCGSQMDRWL